MPTVECIIRPGVRMLGDGNNAGNHMNRSRSSGNRTDYQERDPLDSLSRTIADLEARIEGLNARNRRSPQYPSQTPRPERQQDRVRSPERSTEFYQPQRFQQPEAPVNARDYWEEQDSRLPSFDRDRGFQPATGTPDAGARDIAEALVALREDLRRDLSESISRGLGSHTQDRDIAAGLHAELNELRSMVRELPGEDSMRRLEQRWDGFENRIAGMDATALREELSMLSHRLDDIRSSIGQLPSALPLNALEDKIKMLVGAIDAICRQTGSNDPELNQRFAGLEDRLDEISRAIVATNATRDGEPDRRLIEGLERRFDTLLDQLDAISQTHSYNEVTERLDALSGKIDELSGDRDTVTLMERLDDLSRMLESQPAPAVDERLYEHLELLAHKVGSLDLNGVNDALADKLDDLSRRIDTMTSDLTAAAGNQDMLQGRLEDLAGLMGNQEQERQAVDLSRIETGLANIAARLDEVTAPQGGDGEALRALEEQVANFSRLLSETGHAPAESDDLAPRLAAIEERLGESQADHQNMMLEAARRAAEAAIDSWRESGATASDISMVENLVSDLRSLEELSRRSEEKNTRTFDAVHDTLVKIADRLEAMEYGAPVETAHAVLNASDYPADAPADLVSDAELPRKESSQPDVETNHDAIVLPDDRYDEGSYDTPSIDPADHMDEDEDDTPLEPGSGAPDIESIMAKVREAQKHGQKQGRHAHPDSDAGEDKPGKADFIAAARRAARAAASDTMLAGDAAVPAEDVSDKRKQRAAKGAGKRSKRPFFLAAGAILLAVATYPLLMDFFAGPSPIETASIEPETQISKPVTTETELAEKNDQGAGLTQDFSSAEPVTEEMATDSAPTLPGSSTSPTKPEMTPQSGITSGQNNGEWQMSRDNSVQPVGGFYSYPPEGAVEAQAAAGVDAMTVSTATQADAPVIETPPEEVGPLALRKAAADGDSLALFEIGARYTDGRGVDVDHAEAAKWYQLSADLGFAPAQYRLANFYEKGNGVERDLKKAQTWYQMAAEQGNASAMHNLAVLFAMKHEGVSDYDSSATWFKRAAEFGVRDSQYNLAILHARGNGVPQDLIESYKWFAIVAQSGDKDAARKRDEVANALRPEQLEEARKRVEDWEPAPLDDATNATTIPDEWKGDETTTASIDMKKAVQNIQAILTKNGFDTGGVDGIMGDRTIMAIRDFQSSIGMEPTGEVTEQLVKELLARNG